VRQSASSGCPVGIPWSAPTSRLKSLESAGTGSLDDIAYITTDRAHQFLTVASKISENVLYEDTKLFMWHDQAMTRTGGV
jgi:hypothetical protein